MARYYGAVGGGFYGIRSQSNTVYTTGTIKLGFHFAVNMYSNRLETCYTNQYQPKKCQKQF